MSVLEKLASTLGRRDEQPTVELAESVARTADAAAVAELAAALRHENTDLQSDAIKALYEIGYRQPALLVPYAAAFVEQLGSKNKRMVWGAMTALDALVAVAPDFIFENLSAILSAADAGSVIAKDHAVGILVKLAALPDRRDTALGLLFDLMRDCPPNQLPAYAEQSLPVVAATDFAPRLAAVLTARLGDFEKETKRARVEKVLKKLGIKER